MWEKIKPYVITFSVSVAIPLAVGLLSAFLTKDNMMIYSELNVPPLAPPAWLFPVAWTLLYILMGVSSGLVYLGRDKHTTAANKGLTVYGISLIFNFLWSILFFNMQAFLFSFIWLIGLLFFIIATIYYYKKVSPIAAYLQIPYALWVAFAGYLNLGIFILN
jgi:tryptophan-rich sensory protein